MTIPSWQKIRQCPRSPLLFPGVLHLLLEFTRHNSSQQPTTCRPLARRLRGSSGATRCVAPLAREGTCRLSERTLGRHEWHSRERHAIGSRVPLGRERATLVTPHSRRIAWLSIRSEEGR